MCLSNIDIAILCGGRGSRVASILGDVPKVLAPINGRPYLEWLLDKLKSHGAKRIVLLAGHLHEKIVEWRDNRLFDGLDIDISVEPVQRGTAGAVRYAFPLLKSDPVLIINGDTLSTFNLCQFLDIHRGAPKHSGASILHSSHYDMKKRRGAGFYFIDQWVLDKMMENQETSLEEAIHQYAGSYVASFDWIDIGTPKHLEQAHDFVAHPI